MNYSRHRSRNCTLKLAISLLEARLKIRIYASKYIDYKWSMNSSNHLAFANSAYKKASVSKKENSCYSALLAPAGVCKACASSSTIQLQNALTLN